MELIIGHNRDEWRTFFLFGNLFGNVTEEQATEALRHFGPGEDGERAYREAFPGTSDEDLFELVQTDWLFRMSALHLAEAQVAGGGRAHLYEPAWRSPGKGGLLRACHGTRIFDTPPSVTPYPEETSRHLWQNHTLEALPLADHVTRTA